MLQEKLARGLFCMPLTDATFNWRNHIVKRYGFMLTHARYLTVTASQRQTLRAAVTVDCARVEPKEDSAGKIKGGVGDDEWWLNLYVMFSRVTKMEDMLILRPPPRELLERGPPAAVRQARELFDKRELESVAEAEMLAHRFGIQLPDQ